MFPAGSSCHPLERPFPPTVVVAAWGARSVVHTRGSATAGENAERLRAVRQAAREAGVDIVLNARVDVLGLEGDRRELFEEAVRRARL